MPFHERSKRWTCIVAHRRAGKSVACVMDLITRALATSKEHARYAYLAPFYSQAKAVAFDYLKRFSEPVRQGPPRESELSVTLVNGATIRLFGADNPDALRGQYFDGVVLDEVGDMRESVWKEVIRPALSDRLGWAVFIGTPRGRNHFFDVYENAKRDPDWLCLTLRASETGLINPAELADARRQMSDSAYRQEYECDFDAPILGAIYADELMRCAEEGRITKVAHEPLLPVHTAWDLGMSDATSIWFWQQANNQLRVIDYLEVTGEGLPSIAKMLQAKGYVYGSHYAPHDIQVRELGSGLSRLEAARNLGLLFEMVPNVSVDDGIHALRLMLDRCWFDADKCRVGLDALMHYRRGWDDKRKVLSTKPVHDWSSHAADAARYFALVSQRTRTSPVKRERSGSWMVR